jgi:signal recognition particle subunit SRP19
VSEVGRKDYYVVWVLNFDSTRSRGNGRRIPLNLALRNPTIEELAKAASSLGLDFEVHPEKMHPRAWFEGPGGCLFIKKGGLRKTMLLRNLAKEVNRIRSSSANQ